MQIDSDLRGRTLTAPLIWIDGKFTANVHISIDEEGRIFKVQKHVEENVETDVHNFEGLALLPGFVNGHSHAFHRILRGSSGIGETNSDDFWKWRSNMYKLVEDIDFEKLKEVELGVGRCFSYLKAMKVSVKYCKATFTEMLAAGITTVGEFHYIHHACPTKRDFSLDEAVLDAAVECGIRLVLINTLYLRSGFESTGVEMEQQKRFASDTDAFIGHMEQLRLKMSHNDGISLAVAAHSTRAVESASIKRLWRWASDNQLPFHIHLEEQPKEIEDCLRVEGLRPSQLLLNCAPNNSGAPLTCVHCTYTRREEMEFLSQRGAIVCVCPLTEGFLGDGIPDLEASDQLCLGTDCNNRLDFMEEMRWLSYCQNMKRNKRSCAALNASKLIRIATENGARSLGLEGVVGRFEPGHYMDFVAVDLNSRCLSRSSADALADAIVFGGGNELIKVVGVAGCVRFRT